MNTPASDSSSPDGDAQRLAKRVAALVPCSRREAEQYITEGWVTVDGQRVDTPQERVRPDQKVEVDHQARLRPPQSVTFLLHKPAGLCAEAAAELLSDAHHWPGDTSGIRPSKAHHLGLKALLPLPTPASGLCVFSQDFRVVRKLTVDADFVEQELIAEVHGDIAPGGLKRLRHGLVQGGWALPPARVSWQSETRLRFATKGIPPSIIEWMCAQVGLQLVALRRIRIGRVPMAGLPPGQWCYLPPWARI
jgi:23S rRNA pseudouridine2604 synthase